MTSSDAGALVPALREHELKCWPEFFGPILSGEKTEATCARLEAERDNYRTLAGIGVWHAECRPNREMAARELQKSQAVIDKLADTISRLEAENTALREALALIRDKAGSHTVAILPVNIVNDPTYRGIYAVAIDALAAAPSAPQKETPMQTGHLRRELRTGGHGAEGPVSRLIERLALLVLLFLAVMDILIGED